jgi:hypothetical protein
MVVLRARSRNLPTGYTASRRGISLVDRGKLCRTRRRRRVPGMVPASWSTSSALWEDCSSAKIRASFRGRSCSSARSSGLPRSSKAWWLPRSCSGPRPARAARVLSDRLGRRNLILLAAVTFTVGAVGAALAPSVGVLVLFRIILGLAVGTAALTVPLYLSEIAPTEIRGAITSLNQ